MLYTQVCKLQVFWFVLVLGYEGNHTEGDRRRGKMEGFITGGQDTTIYEFPHSVFLTAFCSPRSDRYWVCGASILNQRILLTAAHCLYGCKNGFKVDAIAGSTNIEAQQVIRKVHKYVNHRYYDPDTDFCDIAVILLDTNLPMGPNIKRVIIRQSFAVGTVGEVAGWGVINDNSDDSPILKRVKQVVRASSACGHVMMREGMMCGSSGTAVDYPALGDSGSAFVSRTHQQLGLVSFKSASSKKKSMIVYTNVSYFYDWIHRQSYRLWCSDQK